MKVHWETIIVPFVIMIDGEEGMIIYEFHRLTRIKKRNKLVLLSED